MTINIYMDVQITRRLKHHQIFAGSKHVATFQNFQDVLQWLDDNGHRKALVWGTTWVYSITIKTRAKLDDVPPWETGEEPA